VTADAAIAFAINSGQDGRVFRDQSDRPIAALLVSPLPRFRSRAAGLAGYRIAAGALDPMAWVGRCRVELPGTAN
jgi:hypothetical protein